MSQSLEGKPSVGRVDGVTSPTRGWFKTHEMSLADAAPVALLVADGDGNVAFSNSSWQNLSGLGTRASAAHGWLGCFGSDSGTGLLALLGQVVADGVARTMDRQLVVDGSRRWTRWWVSRIGEAADSEVMMAVADVDDDHAERETLLFRARHDPLTGLVNRAQFLDLTEHALTTHRRHPSHLAVLYVDLDDFKAVNDGYGHVQGDHVLIAVSAALGDAVRPEDVLARIGGDEFAVMCDRLDAPTDAIAIADRIRGALDEPLVVDHVSWDLGVSVGVAYADGSRETPEAILDRADRAMYADKRGAGHGPSEPSASIGVTAAGAREA